MIANANFDVSENDRYLIYHMLNREVSFEPPRSRKTHSGVVEQIVRNIFSNQVELTMNGRLFRFDEPVAIVHINGSTHGSVVFVYGDLGPELSDDELFSQMRESSEFYGETLNDVLARTRRARRRIVEFLLGEPIPRRKTWSKSQSDAKATA